MEKKIKKIMYKQNNKEIENQKKRKRNSEGEKYN